MRAATIRWSALATCAIILAGCGTTRLAADRAPTTTTTTTTQPAATCPLTDQTPAGSGPVPQRPALAVKVDNYPAARPQTGLDKADIIFEEPVEGGITRYVAVFQCQSTEVGPIRSARNIDIGILGQFGHPILAHVGGIQPVLNNIHNSPLIDIDLRFHGSVLQHPPGRYAPYDTYSSTKALWGLEPNQTTPPTPLFHFSSIVPTGTPVSSIAIPFSSTSNVVWRYDPSTAEYLRYYGSQADVLADGTQNAATNVVVQFVHVTYGPWYENDVGGLEVQANLYQDASGPAEIFRNGIEITGTWHRSSLSEPTQFVSSSGSTISLQPGRTWVELVPSTIHVTAGP